ncbi:hypothetical protein PC123_g20026 [Phytophthora cactorum]|nr:hypothetical protein PC120_g18196 [Phytophthora cactorum]KAG4044545.1 hypothetical protein PC123_g20026 [Phytophthora cactorum]
MVRTQVIARRGRVGKPEDDDRAIVTTTIRQTATTTSGTKSTKTRVKSWFDRLMRCVQQLRPTPDQGSS